MKENLSIWIIVCLGAVAIFLSCDKEEKKLSFYYYPKKNIYYDISKKNYLYSLDGGKTWDSVYNPSNNHPAILGNTITLYGSNDSIWKNNEIHRKLYAGNICTIINDRNRFDSAYNGAKERKAIKKTITGPAIVQKEKSKKGFQRFIESIFKKNKNK